MVWSVNMLEILFSWSSCIHETEIIQDILAENAFAPQYVFLPLVPQSLESTVDTIE